MSKREDTSLLDTSKGQTQNFIPLSVIKTSREELDLPLTVQIHGEHTQQAVKLPSDLHGYVFAVGALFQAQNRLDEDGTQLYTGDGMIYRLSFENGQVTLKSRITKTPCYYADLATTGASERKIWEPKANFARCHPLFSFFAAFRNGGPSRFSLLLGGRNQLNTAFLRVGDRLLVTIDAGRPYEVDIKTLELLAPTGTTEEWIGILPIVRRLINRLTRSGFPFEAYINSAHPVSDVQTSSQEFFTTNYSSGYNGVFQKPVNWLFDQLSQRFMGKAAGKDQFGRFTDLIRYRFPNDSGGESPTLQRWRLEIANGTDKGKPLLVQQSLHQLAITEDYIILADIAFRMEFSQIFAPFLFGFLKHRFFQKHPCLATWIHSTFLQGVLPLPYGILYIVKREDLERYPSATANTCSQPLPAKRIILPREISHFSADYVNPDGKITLHVGHNNGWDVTEWITGYELPVSNKPHREWKLPGMMTGTTDLGSLGKYVIDGETGHLDSIQLIQDSRFTWSLPVHTHRELCREDVSETETKLKSIYWITWGFTWELMPKRIYDAYKSRERRVIDIEELPQADKPQALIRLDTETMTIVDSYEFPRGHFVCTPQFVPSSAPLPEGVDASTHGYIVCIVLSDDPNDVKEEKPKDEFWIFHADNFKKEIYKVSVRADHQSLNLAMTLHSTWMSAESKRSYCKHERCLVRRESVYKDYEVRIKNASQVIQQLFKDIVYPYFIEQKSEQKSREELGISKL